MPTHQVVGCFIAFTTHLYVTLHTVSLEYRKHMPLNKYRLINCLLPSNYKFHFYRYHIWGFTKNSVSKWHHLAELKHHSHQDLCILKLFSRIRGMWTNLLMAPHSLCFDFKTGMKKSLWLQWKKKKKSFRTGITLQMHAETLAWICRKPKTML